jgi:hypothetical protein
MGEDSPGNASVPSQTDDEIPNDFTQKLFSIANVYLQPGIVNSESQNPFSPKKSDTGEM